MKPKRPPQGSKFNQQYTMKLRPIRIVSFSVLLILSAVTFSIIYQGPLKDLLKNDYKFEYSTISSQEIVEPLEWPAFVICRNPFDKNTQKYFEFMSKGLSSNFSSETEYQNLMDEAFFTKSDDIVYSVGFGLDYSTAMVSTSSYGTSINPTFLGHF